MSGRTKGILTVSLLLSTVLAFPDARIGAQLVEGRVLEEGTTRPIEGALLLALRNDSVLARSISAFGGDFRLSLPGGGEWTLRTELIGYAATVESIVLAADDTVEMEVRLPVEPVQVEGMVVTTFAGCRDEGSWAALASVWDRARRILEELATPPSASEAEFTTHVWMRDLGPSGDSTVAVERDTVQTSGGPPLRSLGAGYLSENGFIDVADDSAVYMAPDAATLLSDEFLFSHCYFRDRSREAEGLLGLGFRPWRTSDVHDVEGVLWIPRAPGGEAVIEFMFSSHPWGIRSGLEFGGRVEMVSMPEIGWIVRRWVMTVPRPVKLGRSPARWSYLDRREWGAEVLRALPRRMNPD